MASTIDKQVCYRHIGGRFCQPLLSSRQKHPPERTKLSTCTELSSWKWSIAHWSRTWNKTRLKGTSFNNYRDKSIQVLNVKSLSQNFAIMTRMITGDQWSSVRGSLCLILNFVVVSSILAWVSLICMFQLTFCQ